MLKLNCLFCAKHIEIVRYIGLVHVSHCEYSRRPAPVTAPARPQQTTARDQRRAHTRDSDHAGRNYPVVVLNFPFGHVVIIVIGSAGLYLLLYRVLRFFVAFAFKL